MKMFLFDCPDNTKCGGCNWEVTCLYVLASTRKQAKAMLKSGEAGLCCNCMTDLLVEGGFPECHY